MLIEEKTPPRFLNVFFVERDLRVFVMRCDQMMGKKNKKKSMLLVETSGYHSEWISTQVDILSGHFFLKTETHTQLLRKRVELSGHFVHPVLKNVH